MNELSVVSCQLSVVGCQSLLAWAACSIHRDDFDTVLLLQRPAGQGAGINPAIAAWSGRLGAVRTEETA
jgi:hypothetical protein